MATRWDHVLVDEYQDVNQIQVDIVRLLRPEGVGLTVVGDDAQAVYAFRGADSRHLLELVDSTYRRARWSPGTELPVAAAAPRPGQRRPPDAPVGPPLRLRSRSGRRRRGRGWCGATTRRPRPGWSSTPSSTPPSRAGRSRPGGADARRAPQRSARGGADRAPGAVREVRRAEVPRGGPRQGLHRRDAAARQPVGRDRPGSGCCGCTTASARRGPGRCSTLLAPADADADDRHPEVVAAAPAQSRTALAATLSALTAARAPVHGGRPGAGRARPAPPAVDGPLPRPPGPARRPRPAGLRRRALARPWPTTSPT